MIITHEIGEILEDGHFEGNIYHLPDVQLDRKMYKQVNEVLKTLGGKWKTRVGHVFQGEQVELEGALESAIRSGEVETLDEIIKKFQYYPTPEIVVNTMLAYARVEENDRFLEPSAGQGAISNLVYCKDKVLVEFMESNANILRENISCDETVFFSDFLLLGEEELGKFDKIVMNPPFSKSQDAKHIEHAYNLLKEGGRLVTIAPSNLLEKNMKAYEYLKDLDIEKVELPDGSFKESGTMVNTAIYIIEK